MRPEDMETFLLTCEVLTAMRDWGGIFDKDAEARMRKVQQQVLPRLTRFLGPLAGGGAPGAGTGLSFKLPPVVSRSLGDLLRTMLRVAAIGPQPEILPDLEKILKACPEGTLWYAHGAVLLLDGRYAEAEASFARAAETPAVLNMRRPALYGLAMAAGSQIVNRPGRPPDPAAQKRAREALEAIVRLGPLRKEEGEVLIGTATHAEAHDLARYLLSQWEREMGPVKEVHRRRLDVEFRAGNYQGAVEAADKFLALVPGDADVRQFREESLRRLDAFRRARP
jgi:tetratricopeptide (TPR) repeat protein